MHQERAKIHLRAFTISKIFRGYTPRPPWREGATPSHTHPQHGFAVRDPDLVCTPMLSLTPPKHEILGNSLALGSASKTRVSNTSLCSGNLRSASNANLSITDDGLISRSLLKFTLDGQQAKVIKSRSDPSIIRWIAGKFCSVSFSRAPLCAANSRYNGNYQ
jgi:hypothetical protein